MNSHSSSGRLIRSPCRRGAEWVFGGRVAQQHSCFADVRFGSKADIREHSINVRFTPESGHH
jgi:hypothetical protein